MTDKKFTDEEIIETLERCSKGGGCFRCAMAYMHSANCIRILETECLDLINRQKAEIERLKPTNDEKFRQQDMLAEKTKQHYADLYNEAKDTLKAEAYKEYHIKAKSCLKANRDVEQQIGNNYVVKRIKEIENRFDNILKEMVGEEE